MKELIFDIGMYDGADTEYYLELGYKVVAVEANPVWVAQVQRKYVSQLKSGQLVVLHAALSPDGKPVELTISSRPVLCSIFSDRIDEKENQGKIIAPGITLDQLFVRFGIPKFLKVDIEGADRFCILSLKSTVTPPYISFEIGGDMNELLSHVRDIGYKKFKIINQNTFREISNMNCLYDYVANRVMWRLGFADPGEVKRAGRFFVTGHSSGPVPWLSDGRWRSFDDLQALLQTTRLPGWNDILATVE